MKAYKLATMLTSASLILPYLSSSAAGTTPSTSHTTTVTHSTASRGSSGTVSHRSISRGSPNSGMNNDGAVRPRIDFQYNRSTPVDGRIIVTPRLTGLIEGGTETASRDDAPHESLDHLVLIGDEEGASPGAGNNAGKDSLDRKTRANLTERDDPAARENTTSEVVLSTGGSSPDSSSAQANSKDHKSTPVNGGQANHSTNGQGFIKRLFHNNNHTIEASGAETNVLGGAPAGGVSGAGDASNVSGGATSASSSDITGAVHREIMEVQMRHGTAFVAHHKPVILHTPEGDIKITPGSAAYVMHLGQEVAVYNLSDARKGDITAVLPGNKTIAVPVGHQLLITRHLNSKFEEVNPGKAIVHKNTQKTGTHEGLATFDSEYVPESALDNVPEFARLVNSGRPHDKKIVDQILKMAVIRANLAQH